MVTFVDAEDVVLEWAKANALISGAVGVNTSGNPNVYLGLPVGAPLPAVSIYRSGGAPSGSDAPLDIARITFDCWASSRSTAKAVAAAVVSAVESLNFLTPFKAVNGARLHGAQTLLILFRPDLTAAKPVPRYVVDASFSVIAGGN